MVSMSTPCTRTGKIGRPPQAIRQESGQGHGADGGGARHLAGCLHGWLHRERRSKIAGQSNLIEGNRRQNFPAPAWGRRRWDAHLHEPRPGKPTAFGDNIYSGIAPNRTHSHRTLSQQFRPSGAPGQAVPPPTNSIRTGHPLSAFIYSGIAPDRSGISSANRGP